jgi:hypothetical protein
VFRFISLVSRSLLFIRQLSFENFEEDFSMHFGVTFFAESPLAEMSSRSL